MSLSSFFVRFLIVSALVLSFHVDLTAQWIEESPLANDQFLDLDFPTEKVGYALVRKDDGVTQLFRSTDEGGNWTEIEEEYIKDATRTLQAISFPGENVGYVMLRARTTSLSSYVFKTDDAGKTWTDVSPKGIPVGSGDADVFFTTEDVGHCAVGNLLYRTLDGGKSWAPHYLDQWTNTAEIDFYDGDFGIVGAWDGTFIFRARIYTTQDGGETWDSLYIEDYQTAVSQVDYTDQKTAYALANYSFSAAQPLYKTTDAGKSWDTLRLFFLKDSADHATDMYFLSSRTGFLLTTKGYIYKTEDGGENWSVSHDKTPNIQHISSNGRSLFVGGPKGTLLRSSDQVGLAKVVLQNPSLYPNPCTSSGTLYFQGLTSGSYQLVNTMGRVLVQMDISDQGQLDLANWNLQTGCYFLRNTSDGTSLPLMIQK